MTAGDPEFSILMSTRDRASRLRACLDHFLALDDGHSREFLLVDNGSTDNTGEVLEHFRSNCPWPATLFREERPGVAWGLNRALARARGDFLVFTDDDCYAEPDLLSHYARTLADPRIGYAGGRIMLYDPDDSRMTIKESRIAEMLLPDNLVIPGTIHGANMAFRREALLQIGGFDPNFGAGARFSGYDVDACARASTSGWFGAYDPGPVVHHHHGRKGEAARRLAARYSIGAGAYFAKRLIQSRRRLLDLGAILRFTIARRSPLATLRQLSGSAQYATLRLAGRLHHCDSVSPPCGAQVEAQT